ncbi:unnamed protein product [Amoebophrya sp. A25]|nr:unnamed protein product [Amoebophrya sp. A25]|eukprot:GSA25T00023642001.1
MFDSVLGSYSAGTMRDLRFNTFYPVPFNFRMKNPTLLTQILEASVEPASIRMRTSGEFGVELMVHTCTERGGVGHTATVAFAVFAGRRKKPERADPRGYPLATYVTVAARPGNPGLVVDITDSYLFIKGTGEEPWMPASHVPEQGLFSNGTNGTNSSASGTNSTLLAVGGGESSGELLREDHLPLPRSASRRRAETAPSVNKYGHRQQGLPVWRSSASLLQQESAKFRQRQNLSPHVRLPTVTEAEGSKIFLFPGVPSSNDPAPVVPSATSSSALSDSLYTRNAASSAVPKGLAEALPASVLDPDLENVGILGYTKKKPRSEYTLRLHELTDCGADGIHASEEVPLLIAPLSVSVGFEEVIEGQSGLALAPSAAGKTKSGTSGNTTLLVADTSEELLSDKNGTAIIMYKRRRRREKTSGTRTSTGAGGTSNGTGSGAINASSTQNGTAPSKAVPTAKVKSFEFKVKPKRYSRHMVDYTPLNFKESPFVRVDFKVPFAEETECVVVIATPLDRPWDTPRWRRVRLREVSRTGFSATIEQGRALTSTEELQKMQDWWAAAKNRGWTFNVAPVPPHKEKGLVLNVSNTTNTAATTKASGTSMLQMEAEMMTPWPQQIAYLAVPCTTDEIYTKDTPLESYRKSRVASFGNDVRFWAGKIIAGKDWVRVPVANLKKPLVFATDLTGMRLQKAAPRMKRLGKKWYIRVHEAPLSNCVSRKLTEDSNGAILNQTSAEEEAWIASGHYPQDTLGVLVVEGTVLESTK